MIGSVSFETKARTVDHLGREQIADTPTAISELWKNAYDAYARTVALDIFADELPVAVVSDDGHGMSRREFETRWLVVGTESKATGGATPISDRNGLPLRPRQGQKGIGRLSCANLGPLLLLISKRRNEEVVAALLDWRLFENPFLNLSDIRIPVVNFKAPGEALEHLPALRAALLKNLLGDEDDAPRSERLRKGWSDWDALERERAEDDSAFEPPSRRIAEAIDRLTFKPEHLANWGVWSGDRDQGTALLVSEINYDLLVEADASPDDASAKAARRRFFETLTGFVDPFVAPPDRSHGQADEAAGHDWKGKDFDYAVRVWSDGSFRLIVGPSKEFDRKLLDGMEHILVGQVDEDGIFVGRVKAFGQWIPGECRIDPPKDLIIPRRADSLLGPFEIYIASMEFQALNSTLPKLEFQRFQELAERYSGFMVYRDGLRVLPYGREDNDFFEIESRRSKSAGREFWNHRQMFGRLAITRDANPNLKDKAGREGLLDNRAAKTLKGLVSAILMRSARLYFGSASDVRKEVLQEVQASNKAQRAAEARNKLRQKQRKEFRGKLAVFSKELPMAVSQMESFAQSLHLPDERAVVHAQDKLEEFRARVDELKLGAAPKNLGSLEDTYAAFRESQRAATTLLSAIQAEIELAVERLNPAEPRDLLERQISRHAAQLHARILQWRKAIEALQRSEADRIRQLVQERNRTFHAEAVPLLARFDRGELSYAEAARALERLKSDMYETNESLFGPYAGALESLRESIDLEGLAMFGMEELGDLRAELERLNALAQLGIAVEIVGHELQSYDDIIGAALRRLPEDVRQSRAVRDIEFGYDGLTDQLRFLSPLRLAGQRIQRWITGREIEEYLAEFFKLALSRAEIKLDATDAFRSMQVHEQQSRLYPVFINLVNNSVYWTSTAEPPRRIVLDVVGEEAVVSDSGPGVDPEDVPSLFGLFFTRKARGGRGVGLYLARANLAAGGHRIRYAPPSGMPLPGANFVITFRGGEFNGG
jgi:signal transduction histidine kinase